jgi:hypothetical protein
VLVLAGLLKKHGLRARVAESKTISAGNIVSLEVAKAKLVCLSFLGIGSSPAQVRYLVRRLRRILPSGCLILVGYWADDEVAAPVLLAGSVVRPQVLWLRHHRANR